MKFRIAATLVAIALSAGTASAQRRASVPVESTPTAYELGIDATADIGLGGDSFTDIHIPSGSIRMGFPMSPNISIEPKARLGITSGGGETFTTYRAEVGALYHLDATKMQREGLYVRPTIGVSGFSGGGETFTTYRAEVGALYHLDATKMQREGLYVRPTIGVSGFSGSGSQNTVFAGVGVGYKKPILAQLGMRYEAAFLHNFNNGSSNELELSAGLSWFTH